MAEIGPGRRNSGYSLTQVGFALTNDDRHGARTIPSASKQICSSFRRKDHDMQHAQSRLKLYHSDDPIFVLEMDMTG